jgi:hypothetical protein
MTRVWASKGVGIPATEAVAMMDPGVPCACICSAAYLMPRNTPVTFVCVRARLH